MNNPKRTPPLHTPYKLPLWSPFLPIQPRNHPPSHSSLPPLAINRLGSEIVHFVVIVLLLRWPWIGGDSKSAAGEADRCNSSLSLVQLMASTTFPPIRPGPLSITGEIWQGQKMTNWPSCLIYTRRRCEGFFDLLWYNRPGNWNPSVCGPLLEVEQPPGLGLLPVWRPSVQKDGQIQLTLCKVTSVLPKKQYLAL